MKALGIVRNFDDLGRLVIPKEIRKVQGWGKGQPMEIFMDGDNLVIKAYRKDSEKLEVTKQLEQLLLSNNEDVKLIAANALEFIGRGE